MVVFQNVHDQNELNKCLLGLSGWSHVMLNKCHFNLSNCTTLEMEKSALLQVYKCYILIKILTKTIIDQPPPNSKNNTYSKPNLNPN